MGAHLRCSPVLQALFMIASALPATTTTAVRTIIKGVFIAASLMRGPQSLSVAELSRPVNARCNSSAAEWRSPASGAVLILSLSPQVPGTSVLIGACRRGRGLR
jgi:hypothetical protein